MNDWMPCSRLERRKAVNKKPRKQYKRGFIRLIGFVVILILAGLVVRKVVRPITLCYGEARGVSKVELELREIQKENRELVKQRDYLASESGAQIEARKLGWVMPGERNIVLENQPAASSETENQKRDGLLRRFFNHDER
ncbi:MAG: hypothetical protein Q7N50_05435 [Armatimonadota bacterium]|nr:hypothetical protein [Armatimonadota bacterium]